MIDNLPRVLIIGGICITAAVIVAVVLGLIPFYLSSGSSSSSSSSSSGQTSQSVSVANAMSTSVTQSGRAATKDFLFNWANGGQGVLNVASFETSFYSSFQTIFVSYTTTVTWSYSYSSGTVKGSFNATVYSTSLYMTPSTFSANMKKCDSAITTAASSAPITAVSGILTVGTPMSTMSSSTLIISGSSYQTNGGILYKYMNSAVNSDWFSNGISSRFYSQSFSVSVSSFVFTQPPALSTQSTPSAAQISAAAAAASGSGRMLVY